MNDFITGCSYKVTDRIIEKNIVDQKNYERN